MSYRNRIATVFGGSGFIGRHLIRRLAKSGMAVRVATRHPSQAGFLRTAGHVGQIVPIGASITDEQAVALAVRDADVVINLVGILYESRNSRFQAIQAEGAARVARLARAAGAGRLVHLSALGADAHSASAYARTKAAGEAGVRDAFPEATILRPSIVFGPEDDFFNKFAAIARISPVLPLIGGGRTRFQPVYVGDVAEAIVRVLEQEGAQGRTYELGGPRVYTFRELLELLLAAIGRRRLLVPVPWGMASTLGGILGAIPLKPLLTRDQVEMLKSDTVVSPGAPGLKDLGIAPAAVEVILPTYMDRFRVGGRFSRTQTSA